MPIVAGMFDNLENIQIVLMIYNYPDVSKAQVILSSIFTIAKSGLTTIFFLLLIFAIVRLWIGSMVK